MAIIVTRIVYIALPLLFSGLFSFAQKEKKPLIEGNKFYKEQDYKQSAEAYNKALNLAPANPLANYNMGNTQFRLNKFEDAAGLYNNAIVNSRNKSEKEKSFYNKGVSFSKQQKLEESINAYKEALKLDPADQEARENLQKALLEKKQQDKNKENKDKQNKQDKDNKKDQNKNNKKDQDKQDQNKQDQEKQDQDKQKKPEEQESKLTKQQVEQLLKSAAQKEKEVQQKLQKQEQEKERKRAYQMPEKDW